MCDELNWRGLYMLGSEDKCPLGSQGEPLEALTSRARLADV